MYGMGILQYEELGFGKDDKNLLRWEGVRVIVRMMRVSYNVEGGSFGRDDGRILQCAGWGLC